MELKRLVKSWQLVAGTILHQLTGSIAAGGSIRGVLTTLTYGPATIIPDLSLGNDFVCTITDAVAFVVGAPINPPTATGQDAIIWLTFRNASGGAHGAGTWNAVYKTQATVFPAIATGFSRTIAFRWNGTNWVEVSRTAADVAN